MLVGACAPSCVAPAPPPAAVTLRAATTPAPPPDPLEEALRQPSLSPWPHAVVTSTIAMRRADVAENASPTPGVPYETMAGRELAGHDVDPLERDDRATMLLPCLARRSGPDQTFAAATILADVSGVHGRGAAGSRGRLRALRRGAPRRRHDGPPGAPSEGAGRRARAHARGRGGLGASPGHAGADRESRADARRLRRARGCPPILLLLGARSVDATFLPGPDEARARLLQKARDAFERLVIDYPASDLRAAALIGLGMTLHQASDPRGAARALRAVLCPNRYDFSRDRGGDAGKLPQDHSVDYWKAWEVHRDELRAARARGRRTGPAPAPPADDERTYQSPYEGCVRADLGSTRAYWVMESWRVLGAIHDATGRAFGSYVGGGPFEWNRAATAYRRALDESGDSPARPELLFALGRTLIRQERYRDAVRTLVELLAWLDAHDSDPEMVTRACQLVATSLTHEDFDGPPEDEPFYARPDALDVEPRPAVVEARLRVGIERVSDSSIVPADRTWTPQVYYWLAWEYAAMRQFHSALTVEGAFLKRWPLHRDAPLVQWDTAAAFDALASSWRPGSRERGVYARSAADARATYASLYEGDTAWTRAHRLNEDVLRRARRREWFSP